MILYKALNERGTSPIAEWTWPLPSDDEPGEWVEIDGSAQLCHRGFHGWLTEEKARNAHSSSRYIYEMELDESHSPIVKDHEKVAGTRARLLRLVRDPHGPVVRWADYVWQ